jgi:plastocyanin
MKGRRFKLLTLHRLGFGTTPGGASVDVTLCIPRREEQALRSALRDSPFRVLDGALPVQRQSNSLLVIVHRQWSDELGHSNLETIALREISEILDGRGIRFAVFTTSLRRNDAYRWKHVYDRNTKREYWLALTGADRSLSDHLEHITNQGVEDPSSLKARTALGWDYMSWSTRSLIVLATFVVVGLAIALLSVIDFLNGQQRSGLQAALLLLLAFPGIRAMSRSTTWKPTLQQLLIAIPLIGALLYAITRFVYAEFYGHFGVSPEDIGLSYITVLSQQFMFIAFKSAIIALAWFIMYGSLHESRKVSPAGTFTRFFIDFMTILMFALIVIATLIPDLVNAATVAEDRRNHYSSEDSSLFLWPTFPRVVTQPSGEILSHLPSGSGSNLLYLGNSDKVAYVFDGDSGLLLRLPEDSTPLVLVDYDRVVQLKSERFQPSRLKLKEGEEFTVLALNNDGAKHNFTARGLGLSGHIAPHDTGEARVRPTSAGNSQFYCKYHKAEGMVGQVQVAAEQ